MFRSLRRRIFRLALVSGAGAAANYFFDRERGPERREQAKAKADTMLKRSAPDSGWQPEHTANVFEPPVAASPPPVTSTPPMTAPTLTDVVSTPDREIDPLATRP